MGSTISTYDQEASTHTSTGRGPQIRYNVGYKIVTTYVAEKEEKEKKRKMHKEKIEKENNREGRNLVRLH